MFTEDTFCGIFAQNLLKFSKPQKFFSSKIYKNKPELPRET